MNKRTAGILPVLVLAAQMLCAETHTVPLFSSAGDPTLQGFVRVVNLSDQSGSVSISAYTDTGAMWGETSFQISGNAVYTFNSDDLEYGSTRKGIDGVGVGTSDWHLTFDSDLSLTVSAYLRTRDGFLTSMNRTVEKDPDGVHRVMTFNPGSNTRQVSRRNSDFQINGKTQRGSVPPLPAL